MTDHHAGQRVWSIVETSAFDPVARVSPHERLKDLREQCPVHRDEGVKTWFLTRYGDVRDTVNDRSLWRHWSRAEEGALLRRMDRDPDAPRQDSILLLDEPDHSRVRLPLAKAGTFLALSRYPSAAPAGAMAPEYSNSYTLTFHVLTP